MLALPTSSIYNLFVRINWKNQIIVVLIAVAISLAYSHYQKPQQVAPTSLKAAENKSYLENQVKNTIVKSAHTFQDCYLKYLAQTPKTQEGKVLMDWQIKLDGHVEKPQVVSSVFNDQKMNLCMVGVVETLDFPAPPGDRKVYVSHTFLFKKTQK